MDVLYKYVTHQRALTCIPEVGDGTLRATPPAALNDPFECAVTTTYIIPDYWEENRQLADTLTQINESKPVTAEDVHSARGEYGSLFTRQLLAEQVSTRFGIVSFATDPAHPLLWSHYTTDGSGFAIPINLVRIPNRAVVRVLYTERTPPRSVELIRARLADNNNRYRADKPIKLIMSSTTYGYEEAKDD